MASTVQDFYGISNRTEEAREDLVVRVFFLSQDHVKIALFVISPRDNVDFEQEFIYEMSADAAWIESDLLERVNESF